MDSEYITWLTIGPQPTDTTTLIPFLKDAQEHLKFKYKNITADAGYESEENYLFLEANGQLSYIKPANYEISKTRKYKNDIGKIENMEYDVKKISIPAEMVKLGVDHIRHSKAKQDMQAKKRFINVRTVMDALTKVNASKGIIVKHLWKNGQKHFKLQKHF